MPDQGAIESIAEALEDLAWSPYETDDRSDAQRILDTLAADGYTVVKTEDVQWEYGAPYKTEDGDERVQQFGTEDAARIYGGVEPVRRRVFPWEPVPEGQRR